MKKPTAKQTFHLSRLGLFLLLAAALGITQQSTQHTFWLTYQKHAVLAYATDMSVGGLLAATNQSRAANGLAPLSPNAKLTNSAQMKANDMVANDYWAHISPSGLQPWYWFQQAGYDYSAAGENLAYGFSTSSDVEIGWINSPPHKANVLGNYVDVGFGIANGASYQGSENTVVVAHYGTPVQQVAAPAPTPSTPTPTATTTPAGPTPTAPSTPTPTPPASGTTPSPAPTSSPATPNTPPTTQPTQEVTVPQKTEQPAQAPTAAAANTTSSATEKPVSVLEQLQNGNVPLAIVASLVLIAASTAGFFATHRAYGRHLVQNGQKFILHHPLFDIAALGVTVALILTTTVGRLL